MNKIIRYEADLLRQESMERLFDKNQPARAEPAAQPESTEVQSQAFVLQKPEVPASLPKQIAK